MHRSPTPTFPRFAPLLALYWATLGGLSMACIISLALAGREDQVIDRVLAAAMKAAPPGNSVTPADRAVHIMNTVHTTLNARAMIPSSRTGTETWWLSSISDQFMSPDSNCGSYAAVLTRCLQRAGFEARLGQMLVGDTWGGHIISAVILDGKLIPLDATYNLAFRDSDGSLMDIHAVRAGWTQLRRQCPPEYNPAYSYSDIRFTNWRGIPNWITEPIFGDLSVRAYFLNTHQLHAAVTGTAACLLLVLPPLWSAVRRTRTPKISDA